MSRQSKKILIFTLENNNYENYWLNIMFCMFLINELQTAL